MAKLIIVSVLLCTFVIIGALIDPINGRIIESGDRRLHHRRSPDVAIPDLPSKSDVNDPQVKKYAQQGVETLSGPATLEEILEATFFPPAGKLLQEIKVKVKTDVSKVCKVDVWRESDAEPSVTIECDIKDKKKRDVGEPEIADLPKKLSVDDPEVKKYLQIALDKFGSPTFQNMKPILGEVKEALSYPPSGKLLYSMKFKLGTTKCKKESDEKNCEIDSESGYDDCELEVFRATDEDQQMQMKCSRVGRRKRANEQPMIADLPSKLKVDDPQVKEYAQKGIEKLSVPATLEEILEATFFPPAGKLLQEIKIKVRTDVSKICKVNVWRESDANPSITIECGSEKRRRSLLREPIILDKPIKLSADNPKVKEYVELGLKKYAEDLKDSSVPVLKEIKEAFSYPPVGTLEYSIKIVIGCSKDGSCPRTDKECKVNVWRKNDAGPITVECGKDRRKRDADGPTGPLVMDKPLKIDVTDPEVKKNAQKGVEIYAETATGPNEPILEKIEEALLYPPSGTQLFEIKIKIGTSTCAKGQKENCELKPGGESKPCTVSVFLENGNTRYEVKCN